MRALSRLTVAPNGARRGKADHPALPVTIDEIAATAAACFAAGAGTIHLHVRDAEGQHVLDAGLFDAATEAVAAATDGRMLVQVTTEAVGRYSPAEQRAILAAVSAPAVSLAVRDFFADDEAAPGAALRAAAERGVALQYLLYEPGEIPRLADLAAREVIPPGRFEALFVLGSYGADQADIAALTRYLSGWQAAGLAARAQWMVCTFGRRETRGLAAALAMGGKARVGFENNFLNADGTQAHDNAERVAEIARVAALMGIDTTQDQDS